MNSRPEKQEKRIGEGIYNLEDKTRLRRKKKERKRIAIFNLNNGVGRVKGREKLDEKNDVPDTREGSRKKTLHYK